MNKENIDGQERFVLILNIVLLWAIGQSYESDSVRLLTNRVNRRTLKVESIQKSSNVLSKESRDRPDR